MEAPLEQLRRDLRGLIALEAMQLVLAIGALLAIAVREILVAEDREVAMAITAVVVLAVAFLLLALRIRAGQSLVRRDMCAIEIRHDLEEETARLAERGHPYRGL
jgi:hypothetical protein